MRVDDLKSFLTGSWRVSRRISDHRGSVSGWFSGDAVFSPVDGGLRYQEQGELIWGGLSGPASRAYVYSFDDVHRADVWFDDGGYFHALDLSEGRWRVRHDCADDVYDGAFRVLRDDAWTAVWCVSGPRKGYVLRTRYWRPGGEGRRDPLQATESGAVR